MRLPEQVHFLQLVFGIPCERHLSLSPLIDLNYRFSQNSFKINPKFVLTSAFYFILLRLNFEELLFLVILITSTAHTAISFSTIPAAQLGFSNDEGFP